MEINELKTKCFSCLLEKLVAIKLSVQKLHENENTQKKK
jgi:hypothetical protein